jgi:alkanesulfonate monooxygenase SsuD/methylene tetrahydromethanopterin reductase-like flavin-dependent oxidoreductase (luciferase family)
MRFGYHGAMCNPAFYRPLAIEAEKVGFDTFTLPDSICYPEQGNDTYPYNDSGSREFLDGVPFIDPFVLTAWMASATTALKFSTSVVKAPIRHPVLLAKTVTSLNALIDGRFVFGIGLSPWEEDFLATGTDYHTRGKRMEEIIQIMRGLSTGEYFGWDSPFYKIPRIKLCPVPTQPLRVLYGGHTDPALRRTAKFCDGWISAGGHMNELVDMIDRMKTYRKEYGREGTPFDIQVMGPECYSPDSVKRLAENGVQECLVAFRDSYAGGATGEPDTRTLEQMIGEMHWYADAVIKPVRAAGL